MLPFAFCPLLGLVEFSWPGEDSGMVSCTLESALNREPFFFGLSSCPPFLWSDLESIGTPLAVDVVCVTSPDGTIALADRADFLESLLLLLREDRGSGILDRRRLFVKVDVAG